MSDAAALHTAREAAQELLGHSHVHEATADTHADGSAVVYLTCTGDTIPPGVLATLAERAFALNIAATGTRRSPLLTDATAVEVGGDE